jgi:hypothetical protein
MSCSSQPPLLLTPSPLSPPSVVQEVHISTLPFLPSHPARLLLPHLLLHRPEVLPFRPPWSSVAGEEGEGFQQGAGRRGEDGQTSRQIKASRAVSGHTEMCRSRPQTLPRPRLSTPRQSLPANATPSRLPSLVAAGEEIGDRDGQGHRGG